MMQSNNVSSNTFQISCLVITQLCKKSTHQQPRYGPCSAEITYANTEYMVKIYHKAGRWANFPGSPANILAALS